MFNSLIIAEPLSDILLRVTSFVPTLFLAFFILVIGYVFARAVRKLLSRFLSLIEFDKIMDSVGLSKALRKGGVKDKPSDIVGCVTYWVLMIGVLLMTIKVLGIGVVSSMLDTVLAYIPHVITGAVVLILGMLVAQFVSTLVYITAKNTDMPMPDTLSLLSKLAILVYVTIMYLKEIGFVSIFHGEHYSIFITGTVFAMALAFGLAGKELAGKCLHVFEDKPHHEHK